jgi:hypothetical protein
MYFSAHFSQASPACPSDKSSIKMKLSLKHWWNDTGGKTEAFGEKPAPVSLCPPQILRTLPGKLEVHLNNTII